MVLKKLISKKDTPSYLLEEGIEIIKNKITEKIEKKSGVFVILVAGGTASGKTSAVAKKLCDSFKNAQILSMDNYYRGPSFMKEHPKYNFDQPEVLNLDLFFKHLKELKKGNDVKIPSFDFKNDPVMDAIKIKSSKIIIVEGLFALTDKISKLGDLKVFVDLGVHSQILRRLFRDVDRTGNKASDILKYFLETVSPMHKKYIEPTKSNADYILLNDYIPELESKNAKIKDTKLKFPVPNNIDIKEKLSEIIYKLGGTYTGKTAQTDYFLSPTPGKIKKSDEVFKIRKIDFGRYFFTYFGPKNGDKSYEDRYTMRFFINYDVYMDLKNTFPDNILEISKLRRTFYIGGVMVCLDELESGEKYILFKFEENSKRTIILEILENLGIDARTGTKKTYFELTR